MGDGTWLPSETGDKSRGESWGDDKVKYWKKRNLHLPDAAIYIVDAVMEIGFKETNMILISDPDDTVTWLLENKHNSQS